MLPNYSVIAFALLLSGASCFSQDVDKVIADLQSTIATSQVKETREIGQWEEQRGVYPCNIRNNFAGGLDAEILRDRIAIFDNNAFVTAWVTLLLLEASCVKNGPVPTDQQLYLALDALGTYQDRNSPPGDGIMVFWPQAYNSSVKQWYCNPVNIGKVGKDLDDIYNFIHRVLDDLHLEKLWEKDFSMLQHVLVTEVGAFHIPPDFDDMSVNVGLGSMLSSYHSNPVPYQHWRANNTNFTQMFQAMKKYAYRPFGSGDTSIIDPRTYFYMRDYLHTLDSQYPAAFVTTWAHTITEDYGTRFSFGMPFHVNNIDLTVGTNAVYGITAAVLSELADPRDWFDRDLQNVYENTTSLIVYMIQQNFSSRPDLALTYYPSVYNFYWFTSRTLHLLQTYIAAGHSLPFDAMERVLDKLAAALRGSVTADLLKRATTDDNNGLIYFEDFLGNDDRNIEGRPIKHGEDRICSTAMAVNTLLYIWTSGDVFVPDVPAGVKEVVGNASLWLVKNVKKGKTYNVVFSGSVKSRGDLPFFYPVNLLRFLNGSAVPSNMSQPDPTMVMGVQSLIPEQEYTEMLKERHFGLPTPVDFQGYNQNSFPFWSSQPFTYASAMLALSQYRALLDAGQLPSP